MIDLNVNFYEVKLGESGFSISRIIYLFIRGLICLIRAEKFKIRAFHPTIYTI